MTHRRINVRFDPPARHCEDEQMRAELREFLAELSPEHEARVAFERGDSTPAITHLLTDRPDINDQVKGAYRAFSRRLGAISMQYSTGGVSRGQRHT